jgi:hypothetical protein
MSRILDSVRLAEHQNNTRKMVPYGICILVIDLQRIVRAGLQLIAQILILHHGKEDDNLYLHVSRTSWEC